MLTVHVLVVLATCRLRVIAYEAPHSSVPKRKGDLFSNLSLAEGSRQWGNSGGRDGAVLECACVYVRASESGSEREGGTPDTAGWTGGDSFCRLGLGRLLEMSCSCTGFRGSRSEA